MKKGQDGFTLVEMLCTIVIMLLVSAAVTVGIRLAVQSYADSITHSESQSLCSAVMDAVSDEVRYDTIVQWPDGQEGSMLVFRSRRYTGERYLDVDGNGRVIVIPVDQTDPDRKIQELLPSKAYSNGMRAELTLTPDRSRNLVRVEIQITDKNGRLLAERANDVEILNPSAQQGS